MDALHRWERVLQTILAKRRHRLTGAEYVALLDAIERRGQPAELRQLAIELIRELARHDGPSGKAPFADPELNREYLAAQKAAMPALHAAFQPPSATSRPQQTQEGQESGQARWKAEGRPRPRIQMGGCT